MKLFKSLFYFYSFFYITALLAMEQQIVQKINGDKFSLITKCRQIPSLQELCIPSLAVYVSNLIKYDHSFNIKEFNNFLTFYDSAFPLNKLISLMHEELDEPEWKTCTSRCNTYGIDQLQFIGEKLIWNEKTAGNFYNIYYTTNKNDNNAQYLGHYYHPTSLPFNISSFFGIAYGQNITFKNLETRAEVSYSFGSHPNFSSISSWIKIVASNPQQPYFAVGNEIGEIFIIKLNDTPNNIEIIKLNSQHQQSFSALYFTSNSQLYSCDIEGNIFVWEKRDNYKPQQLPLQQKINSIISSSDSSIVALQHTDETQSSSIIDWNTLTITKHTIGKIVAITESHKILAHKDGYLSTHALDGKKLKSSKLPEITHLCGNQMHSSLLSIPLYIMTTVEVEKKMIPDYINEGSPCGGQPILVQNGTREESQIRTTFLVPKQFSPKKLFKKLSTHN